MKKNVVAAVAAPAGRRSTTTRSFFPRTRIQNERARMKVLSPARPKAREETEKERE